MLVMNFDISAQPGPRVLYRYTAYDEFIRDLININIFNDISDNPGRGDSGLGSY
jgi:hypothetical protein